MSVSESKISTLNMSLLGDAGLKEISLNTDQTDEQFELELSSSKVELTKSTNLFCSSECKLNDIDCSLLEGNDINLSSESLSSSTSLSDSDLTSDSDDSLALSESESITDVTPLNSPYCNSPLPQNKHVVDEKASNNSCGSNHPPEMNVLMKAIEKLELEAKNNPDFAIRDNIQRSGSSEEAKRIELENQRLLKRVISQQNRIRTIYSSSYQPGGKSISCKKEDPEKSDGETADTTKRSGQTSKVADKSCLPRRQKCLSHPSAFIYSCSNHTDAAVSSVCHEKKDNKKCIETKK